MREKFANKIKYVSKSEYSGKYGVFTKSDEFSWQYEWRLVINQSRKSGAYENFKIGSIKDIVYVMNTEKLVASPITINEN